MQNEYIEKKKGNVVDWRGLQIPWRRPRAVNSTVASNSLELILQAANCWTLPPSPPPAPLPPLTMSSSWACSCPRALPFPTAAMATELAETGHGSKDGLVTNINKSRPTDVCMERCRIASMTASNKIHELNRQNALDFCSQSQHAMMYRSRMVPIKYRLSIPSVSSLAGSPTLCILI